MGRFVRAVVAVAIMSLLSGCALGAEESNPLEGEAQGTHGLEKFYDQHVQWKACPKELLAKARDHEGTYECASVNVPVDYDNPDKKTMEIHMLREKAGSDDVQGSIFVNPGGPGGSGIEFMLNGGSMLFSDTIHDEFNIIGFDPRGVGLSNPVRCLTDKELDQQLAASYPDTPEGLEQAGKATQEFGETCLKKNPDMMRFADSYSAAKDIDILRQAVGDKKLSYLGFSYGSYLGQVYAEQFPTHVGRMVLDGIVSPSFTYDQVGYSQARGLEASFKHWIKSCQDVDPQCPLKGMSVDQAVDKVIAFKKELEKKPLPTHDPQRPLTLSLAFTGMIGPLYSQYSYADLNIAMRQALVEGNGSGLLQLADRYNDRNPDGTYANNSNEAFQVINNLDYQPTGTFNDWKKQAEKMEKDMPLLGSDMAWGSYMLSKWPVKSTHKRQVIHAKGAPPIILIGNLHDPATPYEMAKDVRKNIANSRLVTVDSWDHTAYGRGNSCVDDVVDTYLLDGVAPKSDVDCR